MNGSSLKVAKISPDSPLARDGISLDDLGAVGVLTRQGHTEENDVLIDFLRNDLMKWQTLEQVISLQNILSHIMCATWMNLIVWSLSFSLAFCRSGNERKRTSASDSMHGHTIICLCFFHTRIGVCAKCYVVRNL